MKAGKISVDVQNEDAMSALGRSIAPLLSAGDCICLSGPLGAGKSVLARSIVQSLLLEPEEVPSPTFTIVQVYEAIDFEIWHCDLYRLGDQMQVFELGLADAIDSAVCLIEWPDVLENLKPADALNVVFDVQDENRTLTISWNQGDWSEKLKDVS